MTMAERVTTTPVARPPLRRRLLVAAVVAAASVGVAVLFATLHASSFHGDVDQLWAAGRALFGGQNPYDVVGPQGQGVNGQAIRLPYPLTAVLAFFPLLPLPLVAARLAFVAVGAFALACAVTRDGWSRLPIFISGSFIMAVTAAQWEPLLTAAALVPWLGWSFAAKPNVALALFAYRPNRWAVIGSTILLVVSLAVQPAWPRDWLSAVREAPHFAAVVQHMGGPLVLLALLRWRRAEARLLVVLACVPQTTVTYAALPLFLVAESLGENVLLALLTSALLAVQLVLGARYGADGHDMAAWAVYIRKVGDALLWLVFVPCVLMILRRPNEGDVPAWLARLARPIDAVAQRVRWPRRAPRASA